MLIERVTRVRSCWVRGTGQDIGKFDHFNDVGSMAAASAFCVVGVDGAILECIDGGLDKARFVEGVRVDQSLDVVVVTCPTLNGEMNAELGRSAEL